MTSRRRIRRAAGRAGFTLVELIVVLAIIGLMVGVAGPAFLAAATEEDDAASEVVAVLLSARRTALEGASVTEVDIDPRTARTWVRIAGPAAARDTVLELFGDREASIESSGARLRFKFFPDGRAIGDPVVVASGRRRDLVHVDPISGTVLRRQLGEVVQ